VDSRLHHTALDDYERDRIRDNRLMADGWRVLRFTSGQITKHPDEVIRTVRRALRRAPNPFS
jgi:very-short-patch-repair endonuclease